MGALYVRIVRELPRKMNISSLAGCCRTPKSTKITRKHRLQFLGRMLQRQKRQKSPSFIVKTPVKSIGEHRKVRELPRKMNMEEVEEPKKYENLQTKPVLDPFKSTADTRKVRELPRKMNIEEVEEPETMKIYRQNPRASARPPRKLRKFTDETNMQPRNHENSDEFRPTPLRHLDLNTPAFYHYRKNPKRYHTVWGNISRLSTMEAPTIPCCHHRTTLYHLRISLHHITSISLHHLHPNTLRLPRPLPKLQPRLPQAWWLETSVSSVSSGRVPSSPQSAEYTNHLRSQNSGHPKGGEPQKSRKEGKEGTISRLGNWWNCALFRKSFSFRCLSIKSLESHGLIAVLLSSEKCSILSRKRFTWPSFVKEAAARNLTCEEWSHQRLVVSIVPASKLTI